MRENLIELLETVVSPKELLCDGEVRVSTARVADHLIAHGVTFATDNNVGSKWIPVTERLPEDEKKVLCILEDGFFCILEWLSWEWLWNDGHNVYAEKDVTHWMPLPEPPKGD